MFDECKTSFVTNPSDLDLNFHMNNGRYLSLMDLGRMDLMIRSGVFFKLFSQGYYPVVKSESIRFRQSLQLWQKFEMITLIESWDEKDFFISQKFYSRGKMVGEGYIKGRFRQRGKKGSVSTKDLFALVDTDLKEDQMTSKAHTQNKIEDELAKLSD